MKCRVCRGPAVIDLPRHNANFCQEHFVQLCTRQVVKAINDFEMIHEQDRVLVAVSGGKDSLALWDILLELGFDADGLYIGLGIGEYSDESEIFARTFANERARTLHVISLRETYQFDVPTAAKSSNRVPCSACGLSKRHVLDRFTIENGYDVLATGHNLDDEVAVLFGNTMRWDVGYLARQRPVLAERHGFPKKVKPLIRLSEREMAAWCVLRGIDYVVDECPMAVGNKHLRYKTLLNEIEEMSPGSKAAFYLNFLEHMSPLLVSSHESALEELVSCSSCGSPTADTEGVCAFCRLRDRTAELDSVRVSITESRPKK